MWSAYNAPEAKRLEGATIVCEGDVVVLCVAGDNNASESAIKAASEDIIMFAKAEGLTAHANSIEVRVKD